MTLANGVRVRVGVPGLTGGGATVSEVNDAIDDAIGALSIPATINDLSDVSGTPATGDLFQYTGAGWEPYTPEAITVPYSAQFVIDGSGATITTGIKGDLVIPVASTITGITVLHDQSGSTQITIWRDTYANFPPVVGDLILTATTSTAVKGQTTGLSIAIAAGDVLRLNVVSVTSVQRVTLVLDLEREVGP